MSPSLYSQFNNSNALPLACGEQGSLAGGASLRLSPPAFCSKRSIILLPAKSPKGETKAETMKDKLCSNCGIRPRREKNKDSYCAKCRADYMRDYRLGLSKKITANRSKNVRIRLADIYRKAT